MHSPQAPQDFRSLAAALEQRAGRLQLDRQAGQRVREHVVDLAGDPRRLLQTRGAELLLAGARCV